MLGASTQISETSPDWSKSLLEWLCELDPYDLSSVFDMFLFVGSVERHWLTRTHRTANAGGYRAATVHLHHECINKMPIQHQPSVRAVMVHSFYF